MQIILGCGTYQAGQSILSSEHYLIGYQFSHEGRWDAPVSGRIKRVQHTDTTCGLRCCASQCSKNLGCKGFEQETIIALDNEVATDTGRQHKCYLWITGLINDEAGNWVEKKTGVQNTGNAYHQLDESLGEAKTDVNYRAFIRCKPGGSLTDQMTDLAFGLITIIELIQILHDALAMLLVHPNHTFANISTHLILNIDVFANARKDTRK